MFTLIRHSLAVLTVAVGFSAMTATVAHATSPCPSGHCNLQVAPQSCKRVEVINAPRVNLRASNKFRNNSNVIGVAYNHDVFKLKRCTKRGCKIILKTDQGPVGAWIHSNFVSCTRKKKYQQCGLYSVNGGQSTLRRNQNYNPHQTTYTSRNGNVRIHIGNGSGGNHHHHHQGSGQSLSYGQLRINFNISASIH